MEHERFQAGDDDEDPGGEARLSGTRSEDTKTGS